MLTTDLKASGVTTMQAVRYYGPGQDFRQEEMPIPALRPGMALIKVGAAGICHTELHFKNGTLDLGIAPLVLGHEIAGEVIEVADDVTSAQPGDRVVVYYYQGCGRCVWCRQGEENLCPNVVAELGFISDGGYAQYVLAPARNLVSLPPQLSLEAAASLGCSGTTALHSARFVAKVGLGETVVVYGTGAVGFALIQICKLAGATVIAVGRTPAKLQVAQELGADHIVNASQQNPTEEILRLTGDEGADVVFELVGVTETMEHSLSMLRRRGRLVFIGYSQDRWTVYPLLLVIKELQILASVGNTYSELAEVIKLAGQGRLQPVIDHIIGLDGVNAALNALEAGRVKGRIVIQPERGLDKY